ncbi:tRNA (adenosine(37)-N6)-threonylcarbamoyltransferase complex ATPase subunit type 1 TsaE [Verrucomicrobiales bacterium]|nr:tRNA (adenosine(37)-N6)-threonylcarbamoyltransferase complex ATPase subunit type 1 TsaE [Verrucomicrobiales bacterium]|tara:strand:+ start:1119 stop:1538 length:420 start_codon:yes stop_codon:yes gene_type:complete
MSALVIKTANDKEMIDAGSSFAESLEAEDVVALVGDLGAGKTHFSKGVVSGLGAKSDVTSPTFSLVHEYTGGRLPIFHFDFYRIDSSDELIRLGWDEYLDEAGVILVEWADKFPELLPESTIQLHFSIGTNGTHTVTRK